jgi:hypothetical protein
MRSSFGRRHGSMAAVIARRPDPARRAGQKVHECRPAPAASRDLRDPSRLRVTTAALARVVAAFCAASRSMLTGMSESGIAKCQLPRL